MVSVQSRRPSTLAKASSSPASFCWALARHLVGKQFNEFQEGQFDMSKRELLLCYQKGAGEACCGCCG